MRGRGADPNRVVDPNRFASQFSSKQPAGPVNPISAAPSSPRVGTGVVATVPSSAPGTGVPSVGASAGLADTGDTPAQAISAAATPTYGAMSMGAVTSSNRISQNP